MSHFKILYRQFLFRLMDVEFLAASARGDASQLFGQFAAMLVFISLVFCYAALIFGGSPKPQQAIWLAERLLIEATMLVVGIFALLSWESTFPDRRDVQILVPLPVRGRDLFAAKVAAAASSLGLTVLALNSLAGVVWPMALAHAATGSVNPLRFIAAYWITLPAAGLFLYCAILGVQGLAAQLPRGWFLRISSFLQVGAFGLFIAVIFRQPSFLTVQALSAAENQRALAWLPPYWFMGLFNQITGAYQSPAIAALSHRALTNLTIAILAAGGAFVLSWLRTLRKIAEEPDIVPGSRGGIWLPPFGNRMRTALAHFTIRSLARSRQHRMNLAFYLGLGLAISTMTPLLGASLFVLCISILGVRVAFSRPVDLRANWLFQIMPMREGASRQSAIRRTLLVLSVAPVCIGSALAGLAPESVLLLALLGVLLVEVSLIGFRKIPFTCSFLPGKSKVHVMFAGGLFMLPMILINAVEAEQWIVSDIRLYAAAVLVLVIAVVAIRRYLPPGEEIQWEEFPPDELINLGL